MTQGGAVLLVSWGLLKTLFVSISLEAPVVQAERTYPKDNMTSHSLAVGASARK